MRWTWLRFEALGVERLYDLLALRGRVFVVEQGAFLDPDGADRVAWHLLGCDDADDGMGDGMGDGTGDGTGDGAGNGAANGTGHSREGDAGDVDGPGASAGAGNRATAVLRAYLRVVDAGARYPEPSIGRVAVAADRRGRGIGHALVAEGVARCTAAWPGRTIRLSAQSHLERFYARHGFVRCGDPYAEDGIPHLPMQRPAAAGDAAVAGGAPF